MTEFSDISSLVEDLNELGIALSKEQDSIRLMEMILAKAMVIMAADGGTIYSKKADDTLHFEIMRNVSLGTYLGGTSGQEITIPPISLHDESGAPNRRLVVACSVLDDCTINIEDAYSTSEYDFSGTQEFDRRFGYQSRSFLTVPMKNHENEIIGVLQLINKIAPGSEAPVPFTVLDIRILESLASQAAVTMTKQSLIEAQRKLFDAFIQLIAGAIDQKSPYTGGHCRRIPVLTTMLAKATCDIDVGPLRDFSMTEVEMYELEVAGWLHDCGKITIPEYVVDKATKLETIYDRIGTIETRLEILRRDAVIASLQKKLGSSATLDELIADEEDLQARMAELESYRSFVQRCNVGGEFMEEEDIARVDELAQESWSSAQGLIEPLLTEDEVENLKIRRGTLTTDERQVINNHMQITIDMLEKLPYPKHLQRVPEYAGGHHEKMDGTGFPKGLKRHEMSWPARMMAIADIFEALTACDRPYKKPMNLSQALTILGNMKLNNHIDPDLFDVFIHQRVYLDYADQYLTPAQIVDVDLESIPGYQPVS